MSRNDEFETLGSQQSQRQAPGKQQQALPQQQQRRSTPARDFSIESRDDGFDTVPAETINWWLPVLLGSSLGVLATIAIGTRILPQARPAASSSDPSAAITAAVPPAAASESELLLEQAALLAENGNLDGAIDIANSIPAGSATHTEAQQQVATWQGAIATRTQDAELARTQAQAAEAQLQQELATARAELAEARRQQELATARAEAIAAQRQQESTRRPQGTVDAATARRQQQELAAARAEAAAARRQQELATTRARALEAQRQQELAAARAEAAAARRQQELAATRAEAAEAQRQQELAAARAEALEAQRQQELAATRAEAAEAQRQRELARTQTRQRSLGSPNEAPAPARAQQPTASSRTTATDPFLAVNIPRTSAPAATIPPAQVARASSGDSFGFRNVVVRSSTVAIELRDNVDEDGDFITLRVNGRDYATNLLIRNSGKTILVPLEPGQNRVEIVGVKDGQGGITLEANVAGIGNVNSRPIPEGSTAAFTITREQ